MAARGSAEAGNEAFGAGKVAITSEEYMLTAATEASIERSTEEVAVSEMRGPGVGREASVPAIQKAQMGLGEDGVR